MVLGAWLRECPCHTVVVVVVLIVDDDTVVILNHCGVREKREGLMNVWRGREQLNNKKEESIINNKHNSHRRPERMDDVA